MKGKAAHDEAEKANAMCFSFLFIPNYGFCFSWKKKAASVGAQIAEHITRHEYISFTIAFPFCPSPVAEESESRPSSSQRQAAIRRMAAVTLRKSLSAWLMFIVYKFTFSSRKDGE